MSQVEVSRSWVQQVDAAQQINANYTSHSTLCTFTRDTPYVPLEVGKGKKAQKRKRKLEATAAAEGLLRDSEMEWVRQRFLEMEHASVATSSPLEMKGISDVSGQASINVTPDGIAYCVNAASVDAVLSYSASSGQEDAATALMPPGSRAFISDSSQFASGVAPLLTSYDLVVADPPWSNKSVSRSARYRTMPSNESLLDLPVASLLKPNALVAVWCTNAPEHREFVTSRLLPAWGCQHIATAYWLKLCCTRPDRVLQPVLPFVANTTFRRPYEPIFIGRATAASSASTGASSGSDTTEISAPDCPPERFLVASVVSDEPGTHSRKPLLRDILAPFLPAGGRTRLPSIDTGGSGDSESATGAVPAFAGPAAAAAQGSARRTETGTGTGAFRGLELFARSLCRDFDSWGNEPLLFQAAALFKARHGGSGAPGGEDAAEAVEPPQKRARTDHTPLGSHE